MLKAAVVSMVRIYKGKAFKTILKAKNISALALEKGIVCAVTKGVEHGQRVVELQTLYQSSGAVSMKNWKTPTTNVQKVVNTTPVYKSFG